MKKSRIFVKIIIFTGIDAKRSVIFNFASKTHKFYWFYINNIYNQFF